ncbi:heavy-metal-associated domain-containing protein [Flavobacterium sp.]|uniref:heavy-metal-associated domain-containing protein n=1 Tax=Flavobacterium sp. TaxID=239 RepID=UPI00286DB6D9|nr:heavy-metal-associated domain-containing protein [Flavobacterium sp.]
MKNIKVLLATLIITATVFVSCKKNTEEAVTETTITSSGAIAKAETTTFNIDGMTCAMGCAKVIENKLVDLEGVQKATVDFDKKTATIEYDSNIQNPEKIIATVEAVANGKTYKVSGVKNSADKAMLFQEPTQEKDKKVEKKKRKSKKSLEEAAVSDAPAVAKEEKKSGCCSSKKSCSASEKPATM